ncbi:hypothetical protein PHAVU_002G093900 [Phaseolus vulgaris]|uniref:Secreted protein n=1 Tax=Phaseolus vulgaris TaxID=3885 RepID=V7CHR1_PHAVU|nr:hypothetical protein PHAVU_002G093900g [Phaseolus vulgaris]ESW29727.1 hypothetical protein PHAVU_002G093900g [Phaseolus vulgaris]
MFSKWLVVVVDAVVLTVVCRGMKELFRCQITVHQECYGAKHVKDLNSWVSRVGETSDVERKCCLFLVKGTSH